MHVRPWKSLLDSIFYLSSIFVLTALPVLGNLSSQAGGTIIRVTTTRDEINEDGSCSLREALRAANLDAVVDSCPAGDGVDTILIPGGSFTLTERGPGENDGLTGDLDIWESVNIRGAGSDITTFHMDLDFNDRFYEIHSPALIVHISDLRMAGGKILNEEGTSAPEPGGGAIYNLGTLQLTNVVFYLNRAEGMGATGGAIYNASTGKLTLTNVTIDQSYTGDKGGAISNHGEMLLETVRLTWNHGGAIENTAGASAVIENSLFYENGKGVIDEFFVPVGAIVQEGQMVIRGSMFQWNRGRFVGAITNTGDLRIEDSTIMESESWEGPAAIEQVRGKLVLLRSKIRNNGGSFDGGGLVIDDAESVWVEQCLFSGNSSYHGGGIRHRNGPTTIIDTTISNNNAYNGGGLDISGEGVHIINSTISGNSGDDEGGGIFSTGSFTIENSTIAENTSYNGGGLYLGGKDTTIIHTTITRNSTTGLRLDYGVTGTTRIRSSIIAENYGDSEDLEMNDCLVMSGEVRSQGGNLVGTTGDCNWIPAAGDLLGTDNHLIDPLLEPLRDNGGYTRTYALQPGSPALDAAGTQDCPDTDQRGIPRPQGPACDIGAFELQVAQPVLENWIYMPIVQQ